MIARRFRFAVLSAAGVVLAACGSSSSSGSNTTTAAGAGASATTAAASATTAAAGPTTTYDTSGGGYGYPAPGTTAASPATTAAATGSASSVSLASVGTFGQVLVDAKGMSLYMFMKDTAGTSACTGQCATNWPPAMANGTPTAGTGLDSSKLSTITRGEGTTQLAYAGHPLYTFAADSAPGQASGQGVSGVWFLVNAAGEAVKSA